jgi:hypothetical protein
MLSPLLLLLKAEELNAVLSFSAPAGWRCILTKRESSSSAAIVARALPRGRKLGETSAPQCRTCKSEEQRYSGELRGDTFPGQRLKTTEHSIVVQPGQSSRNKKVRFADLQEDGDSVVKQRNLGKHPARVYISCQLLVYRRVFAKELSMRWCASLAVLFCAVVAVAASSSNQSASRIWITDVTIISPENLDNVAVGSVLIDNGRIIRVERTRHARTPPSATVAPAKGMVDGLKLSLPPTRKSLMLAELQKFPDLVTAQEGYRRLQSTVARQGFTLNGKSKAGQKEDAAELNRFLGGLRQSHASAPAIGRAPACAPPWKRWFP